MCEDHYRTNSKVWHCKYCNAEFHSRRKLFAHYKVCDIKESLPKDSLGRTLPNNQGMYKCEFCGYVSPRKFGLTTHVKYCKKNPSHLDKIPCVHSDDARLKMAFAARARVGYSANFNPKACEYIDRLNEKMGWHLQHALNGGEVTVGPYFLDGYDKELNIAFEYDERKHNIQSIRDRDLVRQRFIINTLHCRFYRYNESTNLFYEVI